MRAGRGGVGQGLKEELEIRGKDLQVEAAVLGTGGFGIVYRAQWFGQQVAVKVAKVLGDSDEASLTQEAATLKKLLHDFVVPVRGVCWMVRGAGGEELGPGLVMSLAELGSVKDVLRRQDSVPHRAAAAQLRPWQTLLRFLSQAAYGVAYLHEKKLVHGDLKPSNVLVAPHFQPWIADMGLSGAVGAAEKGGTLNYRSPESFADDVQLSTATDCYALALVCWYLATAATAQDPAGAPEPWQGLTRPQLVQEVCTEEQRPAIPPKWLAEPVLPRFVLVLHRGWAQQAQKRMEAKEAAEQLAGLSAESLLPAQEQALSKSSLVLVAEYPGAFSHLQHPQWHKETDFLKSLQLAEPPQDTEQEELRRQCLALCEALPKNKEALAGGPRGLTAVQSRYNLESLCLWLYTLAQRAPKGWDAAGPFCPDWNAKTLKRHGLKISQSPAEIEARRAVLQRLEEYPNKLAGLAVAGLEHVRLHTVFYGCRGKETALEICKSGFAQLAALDLGWYGQGLYFTFDLEYARQYAVEKNPKAPCLLVCDVALGNVYPVTERADGHHSLLGKPPVPRYDAHMVVVQPRSGHVCGATEAGSVTELVLFDSFAVLPRCIVELRGAVST